MNICFYVICSGQRSVKTNPRTEIKRKTIVPLYGPNRFHKIRFLFSVKQRHSLNNVLPHLILHPKFRGRIAHTTTHHFIVHLIYIIIHHVKITCLQEISSLFLDGKQKAFETNQSKAANDQLRLAHGDVEVKQQLHVPGTSRETLIVFGETMMQAELLPSQSSHGKEYFESDQAH